MRRAVFVGLIGVALAACSPSGQQASQTSAPMQAAPAAVAGPAFPNLFQASYRAEATRTRPDGGTSTMIIVRDGQRTRVEMSTAHGDRIFINNPDTHEMLLVMDQGGQKIAMRMSATTEMDDVASEWRGDAANAVHAVGPCSGAGETGTEWARQTDDGSTNSVCVTSDGIILSAAKNGQPTWQTTRVQRGPQDASQFAAPVGVRVMNVGSGASALLERLRAARKP